MRGLLIAAVILLAPALGPLDARADPPICPEEPPSEVEVSRRLGWIEARFEHDEDDVRRWYAGFIVAHVMLGGANIALAFGVEARANMDEGRWWNTPAASFFVNAVGSTLGLLTLLISTPPILGAGELMRSLPRASAAERLASLRLAEQRLQRSGEATAFVRGPLASTASALYVGAGASMLVLLDLPVHGLVHALGGTILAQGRLLLAPSGPLLAWRTYQAHHPEAACLDPIDPIARYDGGSPRLSIVPIGLGLGLTLAF